MRESDTVSGSFAATAIGASAFRTVTESRECNPLSVDELGKNAARRLHAFAKVHTMWPRFVVKSNRTGKKKKPMPDNFE